MRQSSHEAESTIGHKPLLLLHFISKIDVIISTRSVLISTRSVRRHLGFPPRATAGCVEKDNALSIDRKSLDNHIEAVGLNLREGKGYSDNMVVFEVNLACQPALQAKKKS